MTISAPYHILNVATTVLVLLSASIGFFASIVVLLRRADTLLIGFLSLALSSIGLTRLLLQLSGYLGNLIHFS